MKKILGNFESVCYYPENRIIPTDKCECLSKCELYSISGGKEIGKNNDVEYYLHIETFYNGELVDETLYITTSLVGALDEVKNFVLGGDVNNEYVRDGRF